MGYNILTAAIASGSIGERCYLDVHLMYAFLISGVIYPVTASWVWGGGWLAILGAIEGAGIGPVYVLGGVMGLVGCVFVGPREGVFMNKKSINQTKATKKYRDLEGVDENFIVQVEKNKKTDFKNGYKTPTLKDLKFKDTVDQNVRTKLDISIISRSYPS